MMDLIEITKKNINKFQKGDSVRVIEGSLSNLTGVVINTNDKEVTVLPNREDFNQTLTFQPYELIKNFQIFFAIIMHYEVNNLLRLREPLFGFFAIGPNGEFA